MGRRCVPAKPEIIQTRPQRYQLVFARILAHPVALEDFVNPLGFVERVIRSKPHIRSKLERHRPGDFATNEFPIPVQRSYHAIHLTSAKGHDERCRDLKIRAHANFRDRDEMRLQFLVVNFTSGEHLRKFVAHQLANAELAL